MTYFVTVDSGGVTGGGYSPDGTLPPGAVACTEAQAEAAGPWSTIVGGALVVGAPPSAPAPTLAQQAALALSAGLTLTSPTLGLVSVPFDVRTDSQAHVNAEVTSLLLNATFADGGATVSWPDLLVPSPAQHVWSVTQFKMFATAHAAYVASLYKVINGTLTALPAAAVTIA